jgi:hypothetical protein
VEIDTHTAIFVAENVRLKSLSVKNNGGSVWFQAKNLTVLQSLSLLATSGGVLVQGLNMPSGAEAKISLTVGSVDITTDSAPTVEVTTVNDAVCLVGQFAAYTPPLLQQNHTAAGNTSAHSTPPPSAPPPPSPSALVHRAAMACSSGGGGPCDQPLFEIYAGSSSSSVGVQQIQKSTLSAGPVAVHSGRAFKVRTRQGTEAPTERGGGGVCGGGGGGSRAGWWRWRWWWWWRRGGGWEDLARDLLA